MLMLIISSFGPIHNCFFWFRVWLLQKAGQLADGKAAHKEHQQQTVRRQTALLRPKLIVCLGRIAAKAIIKEDFKITAEHGKWFQRGGVQMTAIYHPSALLRDVEKRPETFVDLKAIQAKVREICTHTDC